MSNEKILIVDDDPLVRWSLTKALRSWGFHPVEGDSVSSGLTAYAAEQPVALLLDIKLPDGSGLEVLSEVKQHNPLAVVIMITGDALVKDTIHALRNGAFDFIRKPVDLEELRVSLRNGIEANLLRREVHRMQDENAQRFSFDQIIGESKALRATLELAQKVAASEVSSVLLQGESGTGKDLLAKALHHTSTRGTNPFVAVNCAAIPATLLESELFGYEKGAFTDARNRKEGLVEQAQGGTLFLDEIGELELNLQAKLLRVIEEGLFRRVGGLKDIPLDVRILAASNRDLKAASQAGSFRLDLYYRLSVIQIDIPALREREMDVVILSDYFISHFNRQLKRNLTGLSPEVRDLFLKYPWPGNVRELRNVIERAVILEDGGNISPRYLPKEFSRCERVAGAEPLPPEAPAAPSSPPPREPEDLLVTLPEQGISIEAVELSLVRQAVARSGGHQANAAKLLGISRDQLRYRLKKIGEAGLASNQHPVPAIRKRWA